ncbi:MAG: prolipoprotein diacylglyceryl transferase, partial [Gammaproteobacteria bacterium]|nr:prolipoprotein diacylglyceryl transferase [Gammaproteobacteria bacterium]
RFPEGLPPSTALQLNSSYGIPIPEGVNPLEVMAVHPTQLYETAAMLLVFWVLWRLRAHAHGTGWLFGAYLLFAGTERFLIEFIRAKDDRFLAAFTVAQLTSIVIAIAGVLLMARWTKHEEVAIPSNSFLLKTSQT